MYSREYIFFFFNVALSYFWCRTLTQMTVLKEEQQLEDNIIMHTLSAVIYAPVIVRRCFFFYPSRARIRQITSNDALICVTSSISYTHYTLVYP